VGEVTKREQWIHTLVLESRTLSYEALNQLRVTACLLGVLTVEMRGSIGHLLWPVPEGSGRRDPGNIGEERLPLHA